MKNVKMMNVKTREQYYEYLFRLVRAGMIIGLLTQI